MSEPFLGEIKLASFNFAPRGWALCNGQLLPINQNQGLFSLLGTTYGGDGLTTFALPDLRSRTPVHVGAGITLGERGGAEQHTLSVAEMPAHGHQVRANAGAGATSTPTNQILSQSGSDIYGSGASPVAMGAASVLNAGNSQAHSNHQPFLVLNFMIALQGIFPSQN